MKKLIAISVMIALIAGVAFADTSVAGAIETRLDLFNGEYGNYEMELADGTTFDPYDGSFPKPTTHGEIGTAWIQLSGSSDDGSMGGTFRVRGTDIAAGDFRWHKAFVWWKPLDVFRIWLGVDADGMLATAQLSDWAFHQGSEGFLTVHNWDWWRFRFPGNWDTFGARLSFYLVPGLDLDLVIPPPGYGGWPRHHNAAVSKSENLDVVYPGKLQLSAAYAIPDVGKIFFTYRGSETAMFDKDNDKFGNIGLSFFSGSLVDGLQFQVGGAMNLSKGDEDIDVGAAVAFSSGDFGVKFRIGVDIRTADDAGMFLVANVMPTFNASSVGRLCLDIGISLDTAGDGKFGMWVNPYLKKSLSGGYFQFGIIFLNNIGARDSHTPVAEKDGNPKSKIFFPMILGFNL